MHGIEAGSGNDVMATGSGEEITRMDRFEQKILLSSWRRGIVNVLLTFWTGTCGRWNQGGVEQIFWMNGRCPESSEACMSDGDFVDVIGVDEIEFLEQFWDVIEAQSVSDK